MDVRCDGNAISKSLPTGISLTSFHWAVSPSAPRQTSSNSKQLDKPGWEEIRLTTRFRWGLLIHLFWANTWFSGSEYRIVHIVSLFATNYLPWIFSKQKSEKNLLKPPSLRETGTCSASSSSVAKNGGAKKSCASPAVQSFHLAIRDPAMFRDDIIRAVFAGMPLPHFFLGPAKTL